METAIHPVCFVICILLLLCQVLFQHFVHFSKFFPFLCLSLCQEEIIAACQDLNPLAIFCNRAASLMVMRPLSSAIAPRVFRRAKVRESVSLIVPR